MRNRVRTLHRLRHGHGRRSSQGSSSKGKAISAAPARSLIMLARRFQNGDFGTAIFQIGLVARSLYVEAQNRWKESSA